MGPDLALEQVDKLWLHELIVVRDSEADDSLVAKLSAELLTQLALMALFQREYQVGPFDQFFCEQVLSAPVRAGRGALDVGPIREHLFRGGAAEAVLAADEEYAHRWIVRANSVGHQGARG